MKVHRKIEKEEYTIIINLYEAQQKSVKDIAKQYNVCSGTIWGILKQKKIVLRKQTWKLSTKHRREHSVQTSGKKNGFYGKQHTAKARKQIGISQIGRKAWNKNIPMKESSKNKLRQYTGDLTSNWKDGRSAKLQLPYLEQKAGRKKPEFCEICKTHESSLKKRLCYDHDHKTNKFRGWLCTRCNLLLGLAKDDKQILLKLIKYLDDHSTH